MPQRATPAAKARGPLIDLLPDQLLGSVFGLVGKQAGCVNRATRALRRPQRTQPTAYSASLAFADSALASPFREWLEPQERDKALAEAAAPPPTDPPPSLLHPPPALQPHAGAGVPPLARVAVHRRGC